MIRKHCFIKILSILIFMSLIAGALEIFSAQAAQSGPGSSPPEGLNANDWSQIQALLSSITSYQQAYLKASNTGADDAYGMSIAVSGDTVVVGAPGEDSNATGVNGNQTDNSASLSGAAYVFTRGGTTWSQQAYLKASNTGGQDYFGASVAIFGDTVVVGAYGEDSNATGVNGLQNDNSANESGAAYVFTRSGTAWSQQAYLKASNTGGQDYFGASVAISGDTVVIGAYGEDSNATGVNGLQSDNSINSSGAAYIFIRSGTTWTQQAYLKASNTGADDRFGNRVAISGDTVMVGADGEDSNATGVNGNQGDNSASNSGATYVFTRSDTSWSQQAYLKASNTDANDQFGISVAISGDTVVVGANGESSNATGVNGNQADDSADYSGAAYVFTRSGTSWNQQAYLKASNTMAGDYFGYSVTISGNMVVIGARFEDSSSTGVNGNQDNDSAADSGAAYVFTRSGTSWSQQAYLKASNTGVDDWFGESVAISEAILVVGARNEDSSASGVNGDQNDNSMNSAGAVYVHLLNNPPTALNLSNVSVNENSPVGTEVGVLTTTDPDPWDTHTYSLDCATPKLDDVFFEIMGDSLQATYIFDYEETNMYDICIRTDDGHGGTFDRDFTIYVLDVVETVSSSFLSFNIYDGHILESGENTNVGGMVDYTSNTLNLGDGAGDKQYRAILSFYTGSLPDNAVITKVTLKIKKQGGVGTNPFTILGGLKVDIRKPFFGPSVGLVPSDFQAAAGKSAAATFGATPVSGWYSATIGSVNYTLINKTGHTQFRLRFAIDDNNDNAADYMKFYSGNYSGVASRPTLVVEYYIP